jgi:hypothetical protein
MYVQEVVPYTRLILDSHMHVIVIILALLATIIATIVNERPTRPACLRHCIYDILILLQPDVTLYRCTGMLYLARAALSILNIKCITIHDVAITNVVAELFLGGI